MAPGDAASRPCSASGHGTFAAMGALGGRTKVAHENDSENRLQRFGLDAMLAEPLALALPCRHSWKKVPRRAVATAARESFLRKSPTKGSLPGLCGFTGVNDGCITHARTCTR